MNHIIRHRIRRVTMVMAGLFLAGLLALHFVLNYQLDRVVGRTLRALVDYRSQGMYRLSYGKISINLLRNRIEVRNLRIKGDTLRYKQKKIHNLVKQSLFEVIIPQAEIRGLNLWKVLIDEKLEIQNFYIRNPQIAVLNYPNEKKRNERLKINNIYKFFADYLDIFRIENLEISNASFTAANPKEISKQFCKIDSIYLIAKQIKIDSTNQPQYSSKPFEVADIELRISKNSLKIPDNQLEMSIGGFYLSTKKAYANVFNLKISNPTVKANIPQVRVGGIAIHQLYFYKTLKINKLWLKNPSIELLKDFSTASNKQVEKISQEAGIKSEVKSVYTLISNYLSSFEIGHILVEKANLDTHQRNIPKLKNISILAHHFYLDSLSEPVRAKRFFIDDFSAHLKGYSLLLPDSLHIASLGDLYVSTQKSTIRAQNINIGLAHQIDSLQPSHNNIVKKDIINIDAPEVLLQVNNLWTSLLTQSLVFEELKLKNAQIQIFRKQKAIEKLPNDSTFFPNPLGFSKGVWLKKLTIENAQIAYYQWENDKDQSPLLHKVFATPALSAQVHDVGRHQDKFFGHMIIEMQDTHAYLSDLQHILEVKRVSFSSISQQLRLGNVQVVALPTAKQAMHVEANLVGLEVDKFDIHQIYQHRKLKIGKVSLLQPAFQLTSKHDDYDLVSKQVNNFLKSIELEEVSLENGQLHLHKEDKKGKINKVSSKQISGNMKSLAMHFGEPPKHKSVKRLESKKDFHWTLGLANFQLANLHFDFPDGSHSLQINTLDFDYEHSLVLLKNVALFPVGTKKLKQNRFQAQIPEIEVDAKDLKLMLEGKNWEIERLKIKKPVADFYIVQGKETKNLALSDLFAKTPFNRLSVNHLEMDSGSVTLAYKPRNQRTHHLSFSNLKLELGHFEVDSAKHHWQQMFDLRHIHFAVGAYKHRLPDGIHQITATRVALLSEDSLLIIKDFSVAPIQKIGIPYSLETQAKQNKIDISAPTIYLKGWDLDSYLEERKLYFSKVLVESPLLKLQLHRQDTTKKVKDLTQKLRADSLYKMIAPFANYLRINDLEILNGNLGLLTYFQGRVNTFQLDSISVQVQNFDIHPIEQKRMVIDEWHTTLPPPFEFDRTPYQFLNAEDIRLTIKNYKFQLPDKVHTLQAKSIYLSTKDSTLTADNVEFTPALDKVAFSKIQKFKKAWYYPRIQSMQIRQFDFYNLLHHEELKMRSLTMDSVKFEIYRDRGLPSDPDYLPKMPQELLRELPFLVKVDSIKCKNASIIYEEQLPTQARAGRLTFERSEAEILNVTNHPDSLKKPNFQVFANFRTEVMGLGKLQINANFYLNDPKNLHFLRGEIGEMPITAFNEMLEYVFPVRVQSGIIKSGKFDIKLDYKNAKGKMLLKYNDLKVEVINRKFASFVANSFVVTNHNPSRRFAPVRVGEIKSRRNLNRSIFSYWGYSVLNGFKTSIGLRGKKQQKKSKLDSNKKVKIKKLKVRKKKQQVVS